MEPKSSLVERLKERIKDPDRATDSPVGKRKAPDAPASEAEVETAEATLGFQLPPTLRQVYIDVANGGFGPAYGLLGVPMKITEARRIAFWEGHNKRIKLPRGDPNWWPAELIPAYSFDIVELYQGYCRPHANDPAWRWPKKLMPVCSLGCGMYMCVDCNELEGAIVQFEPNPRAAGEPLGDYLVPITPSFEAWLGAWLEDREKQMMDEAWQKSPLWKRLLG